MMFGVLVVAPFIVFLWRDWRSIACSLALPFVFHTLLGTGAMDFIPRTELAPDVLHGLGLALGPTSFTLLLVAVITLAVENLRTETRLAASIDDLEYEVNERRHAESLASEQGDQLRTIMQNTPDGIISVDTGGMIRSFNAGAERLFGWIAEDIIGANVGVLMPQSVRGVFGQPFRADSERGDLFDVERETRACRRSGEEFPLGTTLSRCRTSTGPIYVAVLRDLTTKKAAQAEVEQAHRRMAQMAHQAGMAEIASSVLHNVGNVLNSVNVSATLLRESVAQLPAGKLSKLSERLDQASSDLSRPDTRIDMVAAYLVKLDVKVETIRADVDAEVRRFLDKVEHIRSIVVAQNHHAATTEFLETITVASLIEQAIMLNSGSLEAYAINIDMDIEDIPAFPIARHKVLQILVNLLANAKDAMKGHLRRDLRISARMTGDASVAINVQDSGCGMSKDTLNRLFTHGFTTKEDGHGFGLHASVLAAKEVGGTLQARSDGPGQGSTFTFTLPLTSVEAAA